jgi:hypothetical protein
MAISYQPQGLSVLLLDDIPALLGHPNTKEIKDHFVGKEFMCKFPSGQLYYQSKLDLDTDGSAYWKQDKSGQADTATHLADSTALDADSTNYFVLPTGFAPKHHIRKGDIGVVIFGLQLAFACYGDAGPSHHLGEGSIALHRALGHETIRGHDTASGGTLINSGISSGVITIVFPHSGNGFGRTNRECAQIGQPLFDSLKREAAAYKSGLTTVISNLRSSFMPKILQ